MNFELRKTDDTSVRGPLLIPFGIPTQVFISDTPRVAEALAPCRRQAFGARWEAQGTKNTSLAGEAGSFASFNEYFGNLPLLAGRRSSWKKAQVGKQNGGIRGPLKNFNWCL